MYSKNTSTKTERIFVKSCTVYIKTAMFMYTYRGISDKKSNNYNNSGSCFDKNSLAILL